MLPDRLEVFLSRFVTLRCFVMCVALLELCSDELKVKELFVISRKCLFLYLYRLIVLFTHTDL